MCKEVRMRHSRYIKQKRRRWCSKTCNNILGQILASLDNKLVIAYLRIKVKLVMHKTGKCHSNGWQYTDQCTCILTTTQYGDKLYRISKSARLQFIQKIQNLLLKRKFGNKNIAKPMHNHLAMMLGGFKQEMQSLLQLNWYNFLTMQATLRHMSAIQIWN